MLRVTQNSGFGTIAESRRYEYLDNSWTTTPSNPHTFSSISLGYPSRTRRILVGVTSRDGTSSDITDVTIAGVTATLVGRQRNTAGGYLSWAGFWVAHVPEEVTGDIVVTASSVQLNLGVGVWAIWGLTSSTQKQSVSGTTGGNTISVTISLTEGDFCFGIHYDQGIVEGTFTNLTEVFENNTVMGGDTTAATTGSVTISGTGSTASGYNAMSVCSF